MAQILLLRSSNTPERVLALLDDFLEGLAHDLVAKDTFVFGFHTLLLSGFGLGVSFLSVEGFSLSCSSIHMKDLDSRRPPNAVVLLDPPFRRKRRRPTTDLQAFISEDSKL